jgi:hypothetical protein
MNWPPDHVCLSVLMKRWNHAIGLAIMLFVSNPIRKLQESIRHFFIMQVGSAWRKLNCKSMNTEGT